MTDFINDPLGDADADTKRDNIEKYHIDIRELLDPTELGSGRIENSKIIFGGKGAGKTHLLLLIESLIANKRTAIYCPITNPQMIGPVSRYKGNLTPEERVLFWADMWRIAFNMSILSHYLARRPLRVKSLHYFYRNHMSYDNDSIDNSSLHRAFLQYISSEYPEIDRSITHPIDPLQALDYLTDRYRSNESAQSNLIGPLNLAGLEHDLNILLSQSKPIHFLLDGLDEHAFVDPTGWANIQYGLYRAIFQFHKRRNFGQKVHITAGLRNYMYDIIAQDQQFDRGKSFITKLRWSKDAALNFLNTSLRGVSKVNFAHADLLEGENPLSNWLGFSKIDIASRSSTEGVESYFLRHTRMSPRQIVETFNSLVQIQNHRFKSGSRLTPDDFRNVIADGGREHGNALLKTAVEEISVQIPEIQKVVRAVRVEAGTEKPLFSYLTDNLKILISQIGEEVIDREIVRDLLVRQFVSECLDVQIDEISDSTLKKVEDVLWRSGLIAYRRRLSDQFRWEYCWETGASSGMLDTSSVVGFHPTIIDTCELRVSSDGPVF